MPEPAEIHIRPNQSWLVIDWRGLWEYRDLLVLLVQRDFKAKYKQTILGPAWYVIQPLLMTLIFTVVFGKVAKIPTDGLPPFLFYLCGQLAWQYFATSVYSVTSTFQINAQVFGKVYFPRLIAPLSVVISNLVAYTIQAITFLAFWLFFRFGTSAGSELSISASWLLVPLLVLQTAIFALGVGLFLAAFTAKYRDLIHAFGLLIQIWLYATPVIFPLSAVPERWRWVAELNPMAFIVEAYRWALLHQGMWSTFGIAWSLGATALMAFLGLIAFRRVERTFIDTV